VKNKLAPPFKTALFELEFGKGICRESEVIELGLKYKYIKKAGAMYYMDEQSFRGKDSIKRYFAENKAVMEDLMAKLREKLLQTAPERISGRGGEDDDDDDDDDLDEAVVTSVDSTDDELIAAAEA
jgi:recombination protein RecA